MSRFFVGFILGLISLIINIYLYAIANSAQAISKEKYRFLKKLSRILVIGAIIVVSFGQYMGLQ